MWMIEMHIRIPFNLNFIKLIIDTVVLVEEVEVE
jgi:hypothetical protein